MEANGGRTTLKVLPSKSGNISQRSKKDEPVAESWEDASSSSSDSETDTPSHAHAHGRSTVTGANLSVPNAPPPTPISPRSGGSEWGPLNMPMAASAYSSQSSSRRERADEDRDLKRPEKSTAVAGRLIAGALGVRAPKKTEEQRAYDRAVKEQELRKREREKAAREKEKEEDERAKNSVWDG